MRWRLDRSALDRLEPAEDEQPFGEEANFLERMALEPNLLLLAQLDHEREFELCRAAAIHLLGEAVARRRLGQGRG
jgi:hypothetical protein